MLLDLAAAVTTTAYVISDPKRELPNLTWFSQSLAFTVRGFPLNSFSLKRAILFLTSGVSVNQYGGQFDLPVAQNWHEI